MQCVLVACRVMSQIFHFGPAFDLSDFACSVKREYIRRQTEPTQTRKYFSLS